MADRNNNNNHRQNDAAVVSGSDTNGPNFDDGDSVDSSDLEDYRYSSDKKDALYCENMDDEDEAWVYKNLRSGMEETVTMRQQSTNNNNNWKKSKSQKTSPQQGTEQFKQGRVLKPRDSDAVLSCPCCFQIVCMDSQKHEKYENQYRAMFVMNIGVHWDKKMYHDEKTNDLMEFNAGETNGNHKEPSSKVIQLDDDAKSRQKIFYSVFCSSCETEVAALDLQDEIYYFFGCIASS